MKRSTNIYRRATAVAFALLFSAGFSSCSDDDKNTAGVAEEDAVDAIEASLAVESNGVAKMAADASTLAETASVYTAHPDLACGESHSVSYNPVYSGTNFSYDYSGTRMYSLFCGNDGAPMSFDYDAQVQGTYETPRMQSNDSATTNISFTTLTGADVTNVSGTYVRNGSQQSKVRLRRSFTSVVSISLHNMAVNKTTRQITGGTATVSITGTGSNSFYYNGSITFLGNNSATLTINGNTYTINL
jgi:hypothetical protein